MIDLKAMVKQLPKAALSAVSDDAFRLRCRLTDAKAVDIMVTEEIGDDGWGGGVSADEVGDVLAANRKAPVNVYINSPGGLAYDGMRIYNMLTAHEGHVTTINQGLAYSAASVIFMAGDTRQVHRASDFGIHRSHGGGYGNQFFLMQVAEFLDGLDNHLIDIYSQRSGNSPQQVTEWIDGSTGGVMGTMFSGTEAVEAGFAQEVIGHEDQAATQRAGNEERITAARMEQVRKMIANRRAVANLTGIPR